ncbi:50S ribosomal protein L25 [Candidatus Caldipriscus sp.]|nr:50S ribosomal protein L25 [Candidatus Caldipriscus sp.]
MFELEILPREKTGTKASKRYRKEGFVPVEIYGRGEKNIHGLVRKSDLLKILHKIHGESVVLNGKINGKTLPIIIKEIQIHPVTDEILHVDFQMIHAGEEIEIEVPVVIVGEAPRVKAGGVLEVLKKTLTVRALPGNIPPHIEIDVSNLKAGQAIQVKDIQTKDFKILDDPETVVVVVVGSKEESQETGETAQ